MTYEQTLAYIHSLERFGVKPGLERITELLRRLNDPQEAVPCVHVAGTNGKGSTCAMLASGLAEAGYTVGLYTSPYVLDFRERMQIVTKDGARMIPKRDLTRLVETVRPIAESAAADFGDVTEFEFITACAFLWFAAKGVDVAVIEVGLGGRFDATNVIVSPLCSVIATVGLDHTAILGDTVSAIAFEKAGIIKEGCPVVTTYLQPVDALDVIARVCEERHAPLTMPEETHAVIVDRTLTGSDVAYFGRTVQVPFPGDHMVANALTALTAAFVLRDRHGWPLANEKFLAGLAKARLPARQEIIRRDPPLLLDGCHNPDGLRCLADTLRRFFGDGPIEGGLLVVGMLADKDVKSSLSLVAPLFERIVAVTPDNPRAMDADDLADVLRAVAPVAAVETASIADAAAVACANGGLSVVAGSLYLASSVRPLLLAGV